MKGVHKMSYYFSKIVNDSFDAAVAKLTVELKEEGFGVLTEIGNKLKPVIARA